MNTTTKIGSILEINLINKFYYKGKCIDEDSENYILIDKNGDRVEIKKSAVILCREIRI